MSYTIYVLPETDMTIVGAELDGDTQGDGSHMVGATLTLNSNSWVPIEINDPDEDGDSDYATTPASADFRDNDSTQTIQNAIMIDGQSFPAGARVEAEYALTATNGAETFTLVAFNIVGGPGPSYGTVEGLAFVGPQGGFPEVGDTLTITAAQEGPDFNVSEYATPICFVAGTKVTAPGGEQAIETLHVGDLVETLDDGPQPVRWIGRRTVRAVGRFAPIEIRAGVLGNARPLRVSRQHRLQYSGWRAELMFGAREVLVPAFHFAGGPDGIVVEGGLVTYVHILFDSHQMVFAEGALAESFHPCLENLAGVSAQARRELLALFPDLAVGADPIGPVAHLPLTAAEARALFAA